MIHECVPEYVLAVLRGLYCDGCVEGLGDEFTFFDPLVRVHTVKGCLRMFKKLRWLFPNSEITHLEPLEAIELSTTRTSTWYLMEITYRRGAVGTGHAMRSHLLVTTEQGVVIGLEEDWKAPFCIRACSVPLLHGARNLLGRICGL